jgi:MoxR-like ATPase
MATQNPVEQEGTYTLPEAQVDRFMLKVVIDYPQVEDERVIIRQNLEQAGEAIKPVMTAKALLKAQEAAAEVYLDEKIETYIVDLIFATRYPAKYGLGQLEAYINFGASPRGSISLAKAAKCYAFIQGRGFVIPEDVRAIIKDVLRHRIGLTYEAEADLITSETIIDKIVSAVQVP